MKKFLHRKRIAESKKIVSDRIEYLFKKAEEVARKELPLANRYIILARHLSMRFNVPIPDRLKRRFCKHCYTYLVPGLNMRARTKNSKVVYSCLTCQKYMRFPFVREKKKGKALRKS